MLLKINKTVMKSKRRTCGFVSLDPESSIVLTSMSAASDHSPIGFTSSAKLSSCLEFGQDAPQCAAGFVLASQVR
jgi:hypothetical protein